MLDSFPNKDSGGMNDTSTIEPQRRKVDAETIKQEIVDKLAYAVGKDPIVAKDHDWLAATILVVRDRAIDRWMESTRGAYRTGAKRVYYLSVEFLIGRLLRDAMSNLGLVEPIATALKSLGVDLDLIEALEPDAALGNGGLGRLAACFLDSLSTLNLPAVGYGIHYEFGLFRQRFVNGQQVEDADEWTRDGSPWKHAQRIRGGRHADRYPDGRGCRFPGAYQRFRRKLFGADDRPGVHLGAGLERDRRRDCHGPSVQMGPCLRAGRGQYGSFLRQCLLSAR